MELLELTPPEFGVAAAGVYVLDNDRAAICAGPFATDALALSWIEKRQAKSSSPVRDRKGAGNEWAAPGR